MRIACDAAERAEVTIDLMTAPGAALAGGALYCAELLEIGLEGHSDRVAGRIIDCGNRADLVFSALDAGWRLISFAGNPQVSDKLQSIVASAGGTLLRVAPDALNLEAERNALQAAIDWIKK